jgi:hypothetical protein
MNGREFVHLGSLRDVAHFQEQFGFAAYRDPVRPGTGVRRGFTPGAAIDTLWNQDREPLRHSSDGRLGRHGQW